MSDEKKTLQKGRVKGEDRPEEWATGWTSDMRKTTHIMAKKA